MECTKENPGNYPEAVKYASELTGISTHKETVIKHMKDLYRYRRPNKIGWSKSPYGKLKYNADHIRVRAYNDTIHPFMLDGKRFDEDSPLVPKEFLVTVLRRLNEFKLEIKNEGNELYSINGKFFKNINE